MSECQFIFLRGEKKGKICGSSVFEGTDFCHDCFIYCNTRQKIFSPLLTHKKCQKELCGLPVFDGSEFCSICLGKSSYPKFQRPMMLTKNEKKQLTAHIMLVQEQKRLKIRDAALKIQRWWKMDIRYNPDHFICQKWMSQIQSEWDKK